MNKFIKNGEICILPEDWILLNAEKSKEDIIALISHLMQGLDLPYRKIDDVDALDDFFLLSRTDNLIKEGSFYSRYPYKYSFSNLYIDTSKVGNKASDYFHQVSRFKCNSINSPSPYRVWTNPKFRKSLLNSLWTLKVKEVNNTVLRSCIGLRKYIASQFRPSAAKAVYDYFKAEHVLDFSMGWGDRLAGFCAANGTKSYVGLDPNTSLFEGYNRQVHLYQQDKEISFFNSAAEDFDFSGYTDRFDLIFSSPPYFDIERYTNEYNQSWKRYKKLDDWLEKFLYTTIRNMLPTLKSGGHLALNISDVYCHHEIQQICDQTNDFIASLGLNYDGAIGLRMAKRPNSKAEGEGIFAEPIWIWKKC